MAQRPVRGLVDVLVVQNVVAMREGSALDVLSGQAHVDALLQQRAERHRLAQSPVGDLVVDHLLASGQNAQQTAMNDELGRIRWRRGEPVADVNQRLLFDASRRRLQRVLALEETGPRRVEPILVLKPRMKRLIAAQKSKFAVAYLDVRLLFGQVESLVANLLVFVADTLDVVLADDAFAHEPLRVQLQA